MPSANPWGLQVIYCLFKIKGYINLFSEWILFESNNVSPGHGNDSSASTKDVTKRGWHAINLHRQLLMYIT